MFRRIVLLFPSAARRLLAPRYRPERHYMRGSGPACSARQGRGA
jgi:hypothetical protein